MNGEEMNIASLENWTQPI